MKPKIRRVLERAIDNGYDYGWHRAHKYTDTPDKDLMGDHIINAIWYEIDSLFKFDEEGDDDV